MLSVCARARGDLTRIGSAAARASMCRSCWAFSRSAAAAPEGAHTQLCGFRDGSDSMGEARWVHPRLMGASTMDQIPQRDQAPLSGDRPTCWDGISDSSKVVLMALVWWIAAVFVSLQMKAPWGSGSGMGHLRTQVVSQHRNCPSKPLVLCVCVCVCGNPT